MPRDIPSELRISSIKEILGDSYTRQLAFSFPEVMPPVFPCGNRILVQLRTPGSFRTMANGVKLYFPDESVDGEKFRTTTALVRALGPVAFHNRSTMALWPEGAWATPGTFIRVPLYGGDRMEVPHKVDGTERNGIFVILNDTDVIGVITADDPASVKTLL